MPLMSSFPCAGRSAFNKVNDIKMLLSCAYAFHEAPRQAGRFVEIIKIVNNSRV